MQYIAILFLVLSLILFWLSARQRRTSGVPGGRIIYTDTRGWGKLEQPLFDASLGLTGKPDYLVEREGGIIPVEVKSGRAPATPYDSHIFQLAAYCLLVERTYQKRPPYGIIHYADRDFSVEFTRELEAAALELMAEMKQAQRRREMPRSHSEAARCQHCGFSKTCDQKL